MCGRLVCSTHIKSDVTSGAIKQILLLLLCHVCHRLTNSILLYSVGVYLKLLHSNVESAITETSLLQCHRLQYSSE